jgi:hypothetical protein
MTDQKHRRKNVRPRLSLRFLLSSTFAIVVLAALASIGLTIIASPPAPRRPVDPLAPWAGDYEVTWESDPETMLNLHWNRVVSSPTVRMLVVASLLLMAALLLHTTVAILGNRKSRLQQQLLADRPLDKK